MSDNFSVYNTFACSSAFAIPCSVSLDSFMRLSERVNIPKIFGSEIVESTYYKA